MIDLVVDGIVAMCLEDNGEIKVKDKEALDKYLDTDKLPGFVKIED